jgi:hypothetical protein
LASSIGTGALFRLNSSTATAPFSSTARSDGRDAHGIIGSHATTGVPLLIGALLLFPGVAPAQTVQRQSGDVTILVDPRLAYPGGVFTVRVAAARPVNGQVLAVFDGRRIPSSGRAAACARWCRSPRRSSRGEHLMGIEIRTRRGQRRIPMPVTVAPRAYPRGRS